MRSPAPRLALLVAALSSVALALAGCVAPTGTGDGDASAEPASAAGRVLPWSLTDCTFVVWSAPADAAAVAALLPEGFELSTNDGPLAPATGEAYLGFEAFDCAEGSGLDGNVSGMAYGSVFTSVQPPEALRLDGVDEYYYKWDPLVPDAERRAALVAAGMAARDGSATVTPGAADRGPWSAAYTLDGVGAFGIEGVPGPMPFREGGGGPFAEFTPLEGGGHAVWASTYSVEWAGSGNGAFTVESGSWPADVLGATEGAAFFNFGQWSFGPGTLTLPGSG